MHIDRRDTLRWFAAAAFAAPASAWAGDNAAAAGWPNLALAPIQGPGYGQDPSLIEPTLWPLTLTAEQLRAATALCDLILPADGEHPSASAVGVPAFLNEWVSAPYEAQARDRTIIVPGLVWIDEEAKRRSGGKAFADAPRAVHIAILDDIAFAGRVKPGLERAAAFFGRMRALTMGGYYTTPEGWADIGYIGNTPIPGGGDYPGPTPEALAHLKGVLDSLGLKLPS